MISRCRHPRTPRYFVPAYRIQLACLLPAGFAKADPASRKKKGSANPNEVSKRILDRR
jgi:hypothetical protein